MPEYEDWSKPAEGAGIGGRWTPGNVVAEEAPAEAKHEVPDRDKAEAQTDAAPVPADDALSGLDEEQVNACRNMLASGAFAPEEVKRLYGLTDEELASLQGAAPRKVSAIDEELAKIEQIMRTDRHRYDKEFSKRYAELLAAKEQHGRNGNSGMPKEVLDDWAKSGGVAHRLRVAQNTARVAFEALGSEEALADFRRASMRCRRLLSLRCIRTSPWSPVSPSRPVRRMLPSSPSSGVSAPIWSSPGGRNLSAGWA
jgi:hypothetical protein